VGDERDDDVQDLVGEVADEVEARRRLFRICLDPYYLASRLRLHLSRRRHTQPRSIVVVTGAAALVGCAAGNATDRLEKEISGGAHWWI
jgi:hypothetical protein